MNSTHTIRGKRLTRSFYERPTLEVAEEIIGKYIVFDKNGHRKSAKITEVEAYIGQDDPACHAARGMTKRNAIMFGRGGFAYVYLIYGMYHCLNFVTESKGFPAAILLRSAEPIEGFDFCQGSDKKMLSGPGKFCRVFQINLTHNSLDLTNGHLYLQDRGAETTIVKTPRIGISSGKGHLWRICDAQSQFLSQPLKSRRS
ncbi:MAG: DNA-3-methyladenine glycosylase [Candidatus Zixiibacteriota bacterium]